MESSNRLQISSFTHLWMPRLVDLSFVICFVAMHTQHVKTNWSQNAGASLSCLCLHLWMPRLVDLSFVMGSVAMHTQHV